jgi:hypothetical protein
MSAALTFFPDFIGDFDGDLFLIVVYERWFTLLVIFVGFMR